MANTSISSLLNSLANGRSLGFSVVNHGCKVNKVEADTFAAFLSAHGAHLANGDEAQLVIVNTCTVTGEADRKARKAVRHALKESPDALVVVTGCGTAINPEAYDRIDERVQVIDRSELLVILQEGRETPLRMGEGFRTRVNLKIQDGCDRACTYCIVHVARGKAQSTDSAQVLAEAEAYLKRGVKEIVLTGIDLGSYRCGDYDLAKLVKDLIAIADSSIVPDAAGYPLASVQPARIRASSLEPMSVTPQFVDLLARSEGRVCRHLHLPLQSGSSKVLHEMARPYTAEEYASLVSSLYERIPSLSLTTDIIVGFPGETDDDFSQTMELARTCRFSKIHVFPYSKRAGTPAAIRPDQVSPEIIRKRAAQLRALSEDLREQDLAKRRGREELAIVEGRFALTESYHEIPIPRGVPEGMLVPIVNGCLVNEGSLSGRHVSTSEAEVDSRIEHVYSPETSWAEPLLDR